MHVPQMKHALLRQGVRLWHTLPFTSGVEDWSSRVPRERQFAKVGQPLTLPSPPIPTLLKVVSRVWWSEY